MKHLRKRITYANVMSSIAVFLVLGGATAVAATQLAKNSVGSKQIKRNAVTSAKIKKNAVTSAKIKSNAVTGAKVKNGSLTGADINLGTLGTVPSADKANTAAKTSQIAGIYYTANEGSGKVVILSLSGLTITAECPTGEDIQLDATTSVGHSLIDFYTPQDQDYEFNSDFNVGESFDADFGHNNGTFTDIYSLHYANPNGQNVTVELRDSDPEAGPKFNGAAQCYVGGYAITG